MSQIEEYIDKSQRGKTGRIELILGPMFSGKSSELINRINRFKSVLKGRPTFEEGEAILIIKHVIDDRFSVDSVETHEGRNIKAIPARILMDNELIKDKSEKASIIAIDEGQFFEDIAEFSDLQASRGKVVIISALNGTFKRKPFANVSRLIPLADHIDYKSSYCVVCMEPAPFSKRKIESKEEVLVGSSDLYDARCRFHFHS